MLLWMYFTSDVIVDVISCEKISQKNVGKKVIKKIKRRKTFVDKSFSLSRCNFKTLDLPVLLPKEEIFSRKKWFSNQVK
jgi:hypothetical protein